MPINRLIGQLVLVTSIMAVVLVLAGNTFSTMVVTPIRKLHEATDRIAKGDLNYKVGTAAKDEIGELSRAFDHMTGDLKESTTSVDNLNKEIQERKKIERKLQISEEKHRILLGNLPQKIFLKDKNSVYVSCNENYARDLKIKSEEIAGKTDYDFFPEKLVEKYRQDDKRIIESGNIEDIEEKYIQEGRETIVHTVKTPVKDEQGNIVGLLGIFWDVTEQKKTREKIKEAAEEWRRTFNSITDLVFIHDKDFVITKANKAFADVLKMKPEEIVGKKCYKLLHKLDEPWPGCPFKKTKQDGKPYAQEVDDPNIGVPLLVTTSPLFDDEGKVSGSVHIAKDITGLKQAEGRLKEAVKIKSDFTSMVSHELRTPLTAIKEGIGIVQDGTAGKISKEQKEFLNIAKRNVDRLARLINDVLSFQRLEAGKMEFDMKENDINEVVKGVHKEMIPAVKRKKLDFIVKPGRKLPKLRFDRDKVIQVLANLINNAVKFTEEGNITITTAREGNAVRVSVQDTGLGIKEEDMPKLFHSFEQLVNGRDRRTGGTGLGLAISKQIIEMHKGKIWAESKSGKGSTFHFVLPIERKRS